METIPDYKVGDVVIATKEINRVDSRSHLSVDEKATITRVWKSDTSCIIDISIAKRLPMSDIVCFDGQTPVKKQP